MYSDSMQSIINYNVFSLGKCMITLTKKRLRSRINYGLYTKKFDRPY